MVRPNQRLHPAPAAQSAPISTPPPTLTGHWAGQLTRYPSDAAPYGELALVNADSATPHKLDWQHAAPVALTRNVMRLTAPNPGLMTGPGTNSYLVGDASSGYIVIDPGPLEPEHLARLWQATGGDIRAIVCTHSHADHAPGAKPLQALCRQRANTVATGPIAATPTSPAEPPILGLPSAPTARPASHFVPDRTLQDQERLVLHGNGPQGASSHTLQVIHTPGHAANHLCLLLREDGLLFSGDHILNGSTTVIDPPDGDMTAYLDSLDRLAAACEQSAVEFILPAHGYVLGQAAQAIAHLKAHRLRREGKVLRAMQAQPQGTLEDWVALAYDDVAERLWPVAQRSMLAHVQRLQQLHKLNTAPNA